MSKGFRNIERSVKEEYLDWLMTPPVERDPSTKTEMAEQLGVAISTMWRWEQEPEFQEELRLLKTKWGVRFHGEILGRLMDIVQNGTDTSAIQASKVLLPHLDTGPRAVAESDILPEELKAIRDALMENGYVVAEDKDD
jgi:hypothetical protein